MSFSRSSAISLGSGLVFKNEEIRFDDIPDDELRQILQITVNASQILLVENDLFERYLARNDPQQLKTITQILESSKILPKKHGVHFAPQSSFRSYSGSSMSLPEKPSSSVGSYYSGSRRTLSPQMPLRLRITLTHRMVMANEEIEHMKTKLSEFKKFVEKKTISLMAEMEQLGLCLRETHEAKTELEENVVKKGIDPTTGKVPAEKIIRFTDDWLKIADSQIDRLRLKTSTVKSQIKKSMTQLKHREELGEALHEIDFEQLLIENEGCEKKIEQKNRCLLEMKTVVGQYGFKLSYNKHKLNKLTSTLDDIKKKISSKIGQIETLQAVRSSTEVEVKNTEDQLSSLLSFMEQYEAPTILDFVRLKAEFQELRKIYKQLVRRRSLKKMTYKSYYARPYRSTNSSRRESITSSEMFRI